MVIQYWHRCNVIATCHGYKVYGLMKNQNNTPTHTHKHNCEVKKYDWIWDLISLQASCFGFKYPWTGSHFSYMIATFIQSFLWYS